MWSFLVLTVEGKLYTARDIPTMDDALKSVNAIPGKVYMHIDWVQER